MTGTLSSTLDLFLQEPAPPLLWHYTSAAGVLGILKSQEVWATNLSFLNDRKEVDHAIDVANHAIDNFTRFQNFDAEHLTLLASLREWSDAAGRRTYAFSLTEKPDLLSQWRAYCPPSGGYSLGLPSRLLAKMAECQGFMLVRCVYDYSTQYRIMEEFLRAHIAKYDSLRAGGEGEEEARKQISWQFGQHLVVFGATFKHDAFSEEKEWRLLAGHLNEDHPQVDFRSGPMGIVPYFKFRLTDADARDLLGDEGARTTIFIGPCPDPVAAQLAVQFAMTSLLGYSSHSMSEIPYRAL